MTQNGTNKVAIDCPYCRQRFSVRVPLATVFNSPLTSVAVAAHEKPIRCINCAKYCVMGFGQVQIAWAIVPITDEQAAQMEPAKVIVPTLLPPPLKH